MRATPALFALLTAINLGCAPATNPPKKTPDSPAQVTLVRDEPAAEPVRFENPGGMWMPAQLSAHAEQLKKLGLELDPEKLADPKSYPLAAVVSLGGCSASFVSSKGLVITNHHCVTGALQYNSTEDKNLLETGFVAGSLKDEKWNGPTARVYVTQRLTDVSDKVRGGLEKIADDKARYEEIENREKALVAACEKGHPELRCEVVSYFGGAEYRLIEKLEIKDVRLVYAPPRGVGNYGGEVDNWMWPRHGGDFAMYRAYVGKDGKPAEHSDDNVPYQPSQHLKLPSKPLGAGDLVFVAGYPGRTSRLNTADEVDETVNWYFPRRIELYEEYLALLEKLGKDDQVIKIKATPLSRGLANALKYTQGAHEGLTKGGVAKQKRDLDDRLKVWVAARDERKLKYGKVFEDLNEIREKRERTREADAMLWELSFMSKLLGAANTIVRMAEERPKPDAQRDPEFQERNWKRMAEAQQALAKSYARKLDQALFKQALLRTLKLDKDQRPPVMMPLAGNLNPAEAGLDAALDRLYKGTKLEDATLRVKLLNEASSAALRQSRDPFIQLALKLRPAFRELENRDKVSGGAMALVRPRYVAMLREMRGGQLAPDANSTLRVTYGTVRGYKKTPDAEPYEPFTVLSGMVKKNTGQDPFDAPDRVIQAYNAKRFGNYVDKTLGEVPVDFLADLDITGGNSGSPTMNARGELVGLAFDGNYEAMASDWVFIPSITRSIHVDIRYALWMIDVVDRADWLIRELGLTPSAGSQGAAAKP